MRDILALIIFILAVAIIDSPEAVGDWLRKVDEARYINTMYE
jgi:hypothetical protein